MRLSRVMICFVAVVAVGFCSPLTAQQSPDRIDEALVRGTVETVAALIAREYFDVDVAARVDTSLRRRLEEGQYAEVADAESLAKKLTLDLLELTNDKHLAVGILEAATTPGPDESRAAQGKRSNFGVQRVEILDGNVGYLNITAFYRPAEAHTAISAAMRLLENSDALILDVRDNLGGSPETVAFLISHFIGDDGVPLFEVVNRSGEVRSYTTNGAPSDGRNAARPIYVLTSSRTFSGGEGIAFILQEQKRAKIVGEKTAGAANGGHPFPVNSRFDVTIPTFRVLGAVTKQNWEGTGVRPDIAVPAADALRAAHRRALSNLRDQPTQTTDRERQQHAIDSLK